MKIARRRRFAALKEAVMAKASPETGRCNYPKTDKTFCRRRAGENTDHLGTGYCKAHETKAYDPLHRYRGIKNKTVRDKMKELEKQDRDIFDLVPEIQLLRTLLIDYVDRFYVFQEELHAWYKFEKRRPKTALDISEVSKLIEAVTRVIERKRKIEAREAISLEAFRRITEAMGIIVARNVKDVRALEVIEAEWSALSLDAKTVGTGMPVPAHRQLTDGEDDGTSDAGDD